jgi:hypothetical protein
MAEETETTSNPSQWVEDVNKTLDYLQDDIGDLKNTSKRNNIMILAVGAGLAIQGLVTMQIMKAVRQMGNALGQALTPRPMDPSDEAKARVLLNEQVPVDVNKPEPMTNTEVAADAGSAVVVGDSEVSEEVRAVLHTEDNASILHDPTPLGD